MSHEEFINLCFDQIIQSENKKGLHIKTSDIYCIRSHEDMFGISCLLSTYKRSSYFYEFVFNRDVKQIMMTTFKREEESMLDSKGEVLHRYIER